MIKQIRHIINSRRLRWNLSIVQISIIMSPFIDTYKWTEHYVHTVFVLELNSQIEDYLNE